MNVGVGMVGLAWPAIYIAAAPLGLSARESYAVCNVKQLARCACPRSTAAKSTFHFAVRPDGFTHADRRRHAQTMVDIIRSPRRHRIRPTARAAPWRASCVAPSG